MDFTLADIRWLAQNAKRQRSGEMSVSWMAEGLELYFGEGMWRVAPTVMQVKALGALVEPRTNHGKVFRQHEVSIGNDNGAPWRELDRLVDALVDSGDNMSADEWYWHFEKIHPFGDGNGRTGAILWNGHKWRENGGVVQPLEHPPDYHEGVQWFTKYEGAEAPPTARVRETKGLDPSGRGH